MSVCMRPYPVTVVRLFFNVSDSCIIVSSWSQLNLVPFTLWNNALFLKNVPICHIL